MTRDQLLRELRKECKSRGWELEIDRKLGKGSHYRVWTQGGKTTIKSGELSRIYCNLIHEQLGLK
jgi:hypothetical protein